MDARKEYNFRPQTNGKKMPYSTNTNSCSAKNSVPHGTMLGKGSAGGTTMTGGASGRTSLADMSNTSNASDVLSVLENSDQPASATAAPQELFSFMQEINVMFRNFTNGVNTKLDSAISEISVTKSDLEGTKKTVSDLETGLTHTSDP